MTTPLVPPTATEETKQTVILENGTTTFLGGITTTVTVDAAGVRRFTETTARVRANDGRLVDPAQPLFACRCGKTLLTAESVLFCSKCRLPVCRPCVRQRVEHAIAMELCRSCNGGWTRILKDCFSWLVS